MKLTHVWEGGLITWYGREAYNMVGERAYNMVGERAYNMVGERIKAW